MGEHHLASASLVVVLLSAMLVVSAQQPPSDGTLLNAEIPTEAILGAPIYPTAKFLGSYDAGREQKLYLFGTDASFGQMVGYYHQRLDERGDRVFDTPATHQFDTERFNDDRMNYRPSVTIKDYSSNGSLGYLHPSPSGNATRFVTLIQIVTAPPEEARR